jgi:hypothetical protein
MSTIFIISMEIANLWNPVFFSLFINNNMLSLFLINWTIAIKKKSFK